MRGENGEAAGAGAKIENVPTASGIGDDARETIPAHQLADERSRHDDAFIDVEFVPLDPGLTHQVCGRLSRRDALLDCPENALAFLARKAAVEPRVDLVDGQVQRRQDKERRLVDGISRSMTISDFGYVELADGKSKPILNGQEFGWVLCFRRPLLC